MIDKITPDTKVSEICEVLDYIQGETIPPVYIHICKDMTGNIYRTSKDSIIAFEVCNIKELPKYLKSIKKPDDRDYDKILEDPTAVKKILQRLPLKDIISEIHNRTENNEILRTGN